MMIVVSVLYGFAIAVLLLVRGVRPDPSPLSRFELQRRANKGDAASIKALRRKNLLHDVYSLQHVVAAILLVVVSSLGVLLFHWTAGFLVSLLIALEVGAVARLRWVRKLANIVYERLEPNILNLIEKYPRLFRMLRVVAPLSDEPYVLQSKEEVLEVISQADPTALDDQEKQFIIKGLEFESRLVDEIMTPRRQVDYIDKKEVLGPLVLDELHKTGHSRFPVVDKDLDSVIGVLHIKSLLQLSQKRSLTAEKAMDPQVYFIRSDQTLANALAAFLRTRHHLFMVIDEKQNTTGVLSLEDVIEALLGREIRDEFELDDNPHAVAQRSL